MKEDFQEAYEENYHGYMWRPWLNRVRKKNSTILHSKYNIWTSLHVSNKTICFNDVYLVIEVYNELLFNSSLLSIFFEVW